MSGRSPLRRAAAGITIAVLAVLVLAADQFSKHLVLTHLQQGVTKRIVGDALQFHLVFNSGAAFSLGEGITWVFTIAMAVVAAVIVFLALTRVRSRLWTVVLGLLLGGVLGNLSDRLFRDPGFAVGHVVDFILTPWMWFWTPNVAIFNVADMFIVGGMAAVAVLLIVGVELDGSRARKKDAGERADEGEPDDEAADAAERDGEAAEDGGVETAEEGDVERPGAPSARTPGDDGDAAGSGSASARERG